MKATTKLFFAALMLTLSFLGAPSPASALPGACHLRCSYPNTCYDPCMDGEISTTCYAWRDGSCSIGA